MVIFVIEAIMGTSLAFIYTLSLLIPCIVERIVDKESILKYESAILEVQDEEHIQNIDTKDQENIQRLMKRTGMKYKEAKLAYMRQSFNDLQKRINTLALPSADVVDEPRKWSHFQDTAGNESVEITIRGEDIHRDIYCVFTAKIGINGELIVTGDDEKYIPKVMDFIKTHRYIDEQYQLFDTDGKLNVE